MKDRHLTMLVMIGATLLMTVGPAQADRATFERNYDPVGSMLYMYPHDNVRKAQAELKARGYYRGDVDGRMSDELEAALRAFQRAQGLATHGRLDAATTAALGSASEPSASPVTTDDRGTR
jgi:peptidoglycan hydrolase-like protein with peptidoglycan-binding domain